MEVKLLGPGFAAEVRGVGLADVAQSDETYRAVRAAFEEHSVLLFRGQPVTNELQLAYSKRFGPMEVAKAASRGEGTPYSILTNVEPDGSLVPPGPLGVSARPQRDSREPSAAMIAGDRPKSAAAATIEAP